MKEPSYHTQTVNGHTFRMCHLPGGVFEMGSENSKDVYYQESPIHSVKLSPFYMGEFPVTQALWKAVMGPENNPSSFKGDNRPVTDVSWLDIVEGDQDSNGKTAFLSLLNELTKNSRPPECYYRLPTEAEWEYAARAETSFEYSGSDLLKEVGWYKLNSHRETKEVGLKKANDFGLYDMSGNVWEWCQDRFDEKFYEVCAKQGIVENPVCESGHDRVIRGGSWLSSARHCRVSCRNVPLPSLRYDFVGFRLVLSPSSAGMRKRAT